MHKLALAIGACAVSVALVSAQRSSSRGGAQSARVAPTSAQCAAALGQGVKSKRSFCDVIIASRPEDSVSMTFPARSGSATLQFDLHARFPVPAENAPAYVAFARHQAVVAVIRATGQVLGRAVVAQDYRSPLDLFDRIGASAGAGTIATAPGKAEPVTITIPGNVNTIGIVGVKLTVTSKTGEDTSDTAGRPVAIVSNLRLTYLPGR